MAEAAGITSAAADATPSSSSTRTYSLTSPPQPKHDKLGGYDFYRSIGSPKYVVAPMVDQSELAWRLLSKAPLPADLAGPVSTVTTPQGRTLARHVGGAHLTYTPMIHAKVFLNTKGGACDPQFNLTHGEEGSEDAVAGIEGGDRPLIIQFCANDPDILLAAAQKVQDRCDAVDINFGCPQGIARKGHYGSFLQDEWELISRLISTLHENLSVPVTAKFRVFPEVEKTVAYARMMEAAGAQILTCHGRTRDMKGQVTGLADWEQIRAVKQAVSVPVFANGNILYGDDVERCLEVTGCDGVMSAEGNLCNPALFMPPSHPYAYVNALTLAHRYLDIVDALRTPTNGSAMKAHMFRVLRPILEQHHDLRELIVRTGLKEGRVQAYRDALGQIAERLGEDATKPGVPATPIDDATGYRTLPPWVSQPYIRPQPVSAKVPDEGATVPASGQPSRAHSPDAGAVQPQQPCVHPGCSGTAAGRCPTRACLVHCREMRAVTGGLDAAAAAEQAAAGGLVGQGCEAHESKVAARAKRRKEKNAARHADKRARQDKVRQREEQDKAARVAVEV